MTPRRPYRPKQTNKTKQVQCKRTRKRGREGGPRTKTRRGRSQAPCFRACVGVMQVPLQCPCPNIVHASVLKVSYMCLDTSAGTSGNRGGARPSFRMRGPICAGPYLMPPKLLCSLLRQLMWRYRATTYRLIQCSHWYEMVGML